MTAERFPDATFADFMRDREDAVLALIGRFTDAATESGASPVDLQAAALTAAAYTIVMLTPPKALAKRTRDAERTLRMLMRGFEGRARTQGLDIAGQNVEMNLDVSSAFGEAWGHVVAARPIPQKFIDGGIEGPEHWRKVLTASKIDQGMRALYADALGETATDRIISMVATIDACALLCGTLATEMNEDPEGYLDLCTGMFRDTLKRSLDYWREKGAH